MKAGLRHFLIWTAACAVGWTIGHGLENNLPPKVYGTIALTLTIAAAVLCVQMAVILAQQFANERRYARLMKMLEKKIKTGARKAEGKDDGS